MTNTESNLVIKNTKPILSNNQKTFNKLIKKLKELQKEQESINKELDVALQFYHENIKPIEDVFVECAIERVKIAYQFYITPKNLTKGELPYFKEFLIEEIDNILSVKELKDLSDDIKNIYKGLHGSSCEDAYLEVFEDTIEKYQEQFKKAGIDLDFSDLNFNDSEEELMRKMFSKIDPSSNPFDRNKNFKKEKKTKKELEKEAKRLEFEKVQAKSLSSIYKRLARALHPDLEQDVDKRIWKEELMKKLTTAYENNDLYSLLTIEIEWMNYSAGNMKSQDDSEIKVYNAILKDQIHELQSNIDQLITNPRYMSIQKFYIGSFSGLARLQKELVNIKKVVKDFQGLLIKLKTSDAKNIFKAMAQEHKNRSKELDFLDELFS